MVSESEQTGVTLPYEKIAMAGGEMPDGLEYPDQVLFLELRIVQEGYYRQANCYEREKKRLLDNYRVYQFNEKMGKEWVEQIRLTEIARADYHKERTLENADRLVALIEGRNL